MADIEMAGCAARRFELPNWSGTQAARRFVTIGRWQRGVPELRSRKWRIVAVQDAEPVRPPTPEWSLQGRRSSAARSSLFQAPPGSILKSPPLLPSETAVRRICAHSGTSPI